MATDRHQAPSYPLRMPDELKAQAQAAADASGRSLHAELLHRLQQSFEQKERESLMLEAARLHGALTGTKEALQAIVGESTAQISSLVRAGKVGERVIDQLEEGFDALAELATDLLDGEIKDQKAARSELESLLENRASLGPEIEAARVPSFRPLVDAIREIPR